MNPGLGRYAFVALASLEFGAAGLWALLIVLVLVLFALATGFLFGQLPTLGPDGLRWKSVGRRKRKSEEG